MTMFGLTGGIGCGKSTIATLLAEYPDVAIHNCDNISKQVLSSADPSLRYAISDTLGEEVFPGGSPNFARIAAIIFSDPAARYGLESMLHPPIWQIIRERILSHPGKLNIVESAILYETGSNGRCAAIIVVTCTREEQVRRLLEKRGMTRSDVEARLNAQMSLQEKEALAAFIVRTDGNKDSLREKVETLYRSLKEFADEQR